MVGVGSGVSGVSSGISISGVISGLTAGVTAGETIGVSSGSGSGVTTVEVLRVLVCALMEKQYSDLAASVHLFHLRNKNFDLHQYRQLL